jgi:predicted DNA-binding protein (UPF0251 family)
VELTTVPRGVPRRWRWRGPHGVAGTSESYEVVYLPVRSVEGLNLGNCVEIYDYEVEALRLVHLEGLTTEEAAARMGMSKATFWRVLESCRLKVAQALAERKPIKLVSSSQRDREGKGL